MQVEFSNDFDNVLASLDSGKADLAISGVSKTEESHLRFFNSTTLQQG